MFKTRFLLSSSLFMLAFIYSCATNKVDTNNGSITQNNAVEQKQVKHDSEVWQEKYEQGVDFVASGSKPFWTLEIHGDMLIDFKTINPENGGIRVPMSVVAELKEGENITYHAETSDGKFVLKLRREDCQDLITGKTSLYTVMVQYNNMEYQGCGNYLNDSRLEGDWILAQLNGKEVAVEKKPFLSFSLANRSVSGNAGCNRISGSLDAKRHTLYFGAMAATRMACPNLEIENEVLKLLNMSEFEYMIVEGKLVLFQNGGEVMVLQK